MSSISQRATRAVGVPTMLAADLRILWLANWSSAIYCALGLTGFALLAGFWPPPGPALTAEQLAAYFEAHHTGILAGMVMMAFAGPWYYVWSAVVSKVIGRNESPMGVLSTVELLGGLLTALVTFVPPTIWITAALRPGFRSPQEIQLMYDFGWMFFDLTFVGSSLQMLAYGLAVLADRRAEPLLPRWTAWLAFAVGLTYLPLVFMPFFQTGPFAWNGLISFWAVFVMFFLFIVAVAPLIPSALRRIQQEGLGS